MIANALLVPVESPPTLMEIKRTLLTYDNVYLFDPADRDMIPRHMFLNAYSGGLTPFAPDLPSPVRPMGKIKEYDDSFSSLFEAAQSATNSGHLQIYRPDTSNDPKPGLAWFRDPVPYFYPGKYAFVTAHYRGLAYQREFLQLAMPSRNSLHALISDSSTDWESIAPGGLDDTPLAFESRGTNVKFYPDLASLYDGDCAIDLSLNNLARNRLGSFTRAAMEAHESGLNVITSDRGIQRVLNKLSSYVDFKDVAESSDRFEQLQLLNRVSRIVVSEYVDDDLINSKSFPEILKLRDRAWGKERENRIKLMGEIREMAATSSNEAGFEHQVRKALDKYIQANTPYLTSLKSNGMQVVISLIASTASGLGSDWLFRPLPTSTSLMISIATGIVSTISQQFAAHYDVRKSRSYEGYSIGGAYDPFLK